MILSKWIYRFDTIPIKIAKKRKVYKLYLEV